MQQDAGPMSEVPLLLPVLQQDSLQRPQLQVQAAPLHLILLPLHALRGGQHIQEYPVREIADIEGAGALLVAVPVEGGNKNLVFRLLPEHILAAAHQAGKDKHIPLRVQGQDFPGLKGRVLIAQAYDMPVPAAQGHVPALPLVGAAVGGVLEALHAQLVAVVHAGHTGICHLEKRRQHQPRLAQLVMLRVQLGAYLVYGRHPIIVGGLPQKRNGPFPVMAADKGG